MSPTESETQCFECPKLRDSAYVQLNYANHHGQRLGRGQVGDCDSKRQCGVCTSNGRIDWSECVHPLSPGKP